VFPSPAQNLRSPTSIFNGATFINPKAGQIVHPGETIHIDLAVDSGITPVKGLGIVSLMGFSNEFRESPPYSFTFTVPDKGLTGRGQPLIGFQDLTLFGAVVGRKNYALAVTTIDVEEPDLPLSLFAAGNMMSQYDSGPNHLNLHGAGDEQQIGIYAKFPNGNELDVTGSTYLSLSSENPAVALVTAYGTVAAVEPGLTRVIATYSLGPLKRRLYIPVTVHDQDHVLDVSPATYDFGNIPSNTASPPLQVTITNRARREVKIFKVETGGFRASPENCSNSTLPPGGVCTITVTFAPIRPGPVHWRIFVPNNFTSILSISLFGKGT
jgi:hypothetical protein